MIRRATTHRQHQLAKYRRLRPKFLETHPICFACYRWTTPENRTLHHWAGRIGELLCWEPGFRTAHLKCHDWIERHRNEAVKLGLRAPDNLFNRPSLVIK